MNWVNYFVTNLHAAGVTGHLPAEKLSATIAKHKGGEAYHCAFDLVDEQLKVEEDTGTLDEKGKPVYRYHAQTPETLKRWPKTVSKYEGPMRPAFGYVWFDFDSHDGGIQALKDAGAFAKWLQAPACVFFYSGSKGFHIGIPFGYFGLEASPTLGKTLNQLATTLKKTYPSLDTTVFNANRKFRALGTKHPKTGLYKIQIKDLNAKLDDMKMLARRRGNLSFPEAPAVKPLPKLEVKGAPKVGDSIPIDELKRYRQPSGERAFKECEFLKWAKDKPNAVNEPQWYAAASIVGRFEKGRKQFHEMSESHSAYTSASCDNKLDQALLASGPRTCQAIAALWDGCTKCIHFEKISSPIVILEKEVIATEATGFYELIRKEGSDEIKRVPNYNDLLSAFRRDKPYKTIADMKAVYTFNGTHYVDFSPIEINAFAEDYFWPKPKQTMRNEFFHKVMANDVARREFFSQGTEGRINFKNGVLDLNSKNLIEHSSELGFRHVLPYEYTPGASCPVFDAWILDVMLGDVALVSILQEYMGYVIRGGEYRYHKALWLSGSGRNGKSTFLSVLKALIGKGNYSTLSIRQIINDKFSSADLDGKIANFSEETSPEELSDSGPFKNLTGDGDIQAQKKYGDPYSFRNRAKMIMTYNEVPQLKDLSPGMLSRPIIIPWKKDLTDESLQDKSLSAKLVAELPGIFNFALAGWFRLESTGYFTKSAKSELEMEEVRKSSCSVAQWVSETLQFTAPILESGEPLKPRQMYEAYKQTIGQYAYGEQKFYKRLNSIPEVVKRRFRPEKGTEYYSMKFRRSSINPVEF